MDVDNTAYVHVARMIKRQGKLEYLDPKDRDLFLKRVEVMRENQVVEMITDFSLDNGKSSQIARVHMLIGKISKFTGDTDGAVKIEVKKRASLNKPGGGLKSFKYCSKEELEFAIECAVALGDYVGINIR